MRRLNKIQQPLTLHSVEIISRQAAAQHMLFIDPVPYNVY